MSLEIKVPDMGESVTEATVASWLKKVGETVKADEPLVELDTDKATLEMPAPASGVLREILVEAGEDVEVGAVLGRMEEGASGDGKAGAGSEGKTEEEPEKEDRRAKDEPGEATKKEPASVEEAPAQEPASEEEAPERARRARERAGKAPEGGNGKRAAGEKTPKAEPDEELDPSGIGRSGAEGGVALSDLLTYLGHGSPEALERSGPAVRKMVAEHGLDPTQIPASGREGRITKDDVLKALAARKEEAAEAPSPPPGVVSPSPAEPRADVLHEAPEERVRMSRLRRTMAKRLKEAQNTAAILTTFNEADMTAVIALRKRYRESFEKKHGVRLGFLSFFVKASVAALQEWPELNAEVDGDTIVYRRYVNVGIAVSTDQGLKVPVVRNCEGKTFAEIETEVAALADRARDGSLSLEAMENGTFSISNGGVFGSLVSTPILNYPQSAILGLHRIQDRPVAVDGEVVVRPMMYLALSYDHRIVDGREAVTFLNRVKDLVEAPERLMLDL